MTAKIYFKDFKRNANEGTGKLTFCKVIFKIKIFWNQGLACDTVLKFGVKFEKIF